MQSSSPHPESEQVAVQDIAPMGFYDTVRLERAETESE